MNTPMHARDVDQQLRFTMSLGPLDELATTVRYKVGAPIYTCGEPARFWYRIVAGAARQCAFSRGGHRHIVDFLRPGDLFGFDARETHPFSNCLRHDGRALPEKPGGASRRLRSRRRAADT
jgi:CRP-like cAMP-binding protein